MMMVCSPVDEFLVCLRYRDLKLFLDQNLNSLAVSPKATPR